MAAVKTTLCIGERTVKVFHVVVRCYKLLFLSSKVRDAFNMFDTKASGKINIFDVCG